jgi:hypothetical protein
VLLDDEGARARPIEKSRLVRRNLLADAGLREAGDPGPEGVCIGKAQLRYDIADERAVLLMVQLVSAHEIPALVDGRDGCKTADERYVVVLVVVDELLHAEPVFLAKKRDFLEHMRLLKA